MTKINQDMYKLYSLNRNWINHGSQYVHPQKEQTYSEIRLFFIKVDVVFVFLSCVNYVLNVCKIGDVVHCRIVMLVSYSFLCCELESDDFLHLSWFPVSDSIGAMRYENNRLFVHVSRMNWLLYLIPLCTMQDSVLFMINVHLPFGIEKNKASYVLYGSNSSRIDIFFLWFISFFLQKNSFRIQNDMDSVFQQKSHFQNETMKCHS